MKKNRILLVCGILIGNVLSSVAQPIGDAVRRILFLGNSITYAGSYVTAVEAYWVSRHPQHQIEFINAGLPSETVSGLSEPGHADGRFPRPDLHERLHRVLAQTKPDLVFVCYGMNDGIGKPFDEERFAKFKEGINWLRSELLKTYVRVIHLTPPIYDEQRGPSKGYANVLDKYSDWLIDQKKKAGWEVIDVHYPMKTYLDEHRKLDTRLGIDGVALANDGVHPGEAGHWIMAKQVLLYLGEKEAKSFPSIKAAMTPVKNGSELLKLISERQSFMKDAWLTATGHKRPEMKTGLPLNEAQKKAQGIEEQIRALLK